MKKVFGTAQSWLLQLSLIKKVILLGCIVAVIAVGVVYIPQLQQKKVSYQTTKAAKGTLTLSVAGSGTISSGNSTNITTGASGEVTAVYVTNGDVVEKGDKIADIALDDYGTERQAYYYSKYVDALVAAKTAEANKSAYDIEMWEAQKAIDDAQDNIEYRDINAINPDTHEDYTLAEKAVIDKSLEKARKQFAAAELKYKNADAQIVKAQTQVTATWRDYQEVSSTIVAPANGVVSNLALYPDVVIESSST
ncbi:MAG: biotin/lipoyl-binding protein, partial [Candidatus Roizmanbacteria bacterium]|nr:biotin/lipoyl-binding protein [Candidatus Roizmanbacteria bacterium]